MVTMDVRGEIEAGNTVWAHVALSRGDAQLKITQVFDDGAMIAEDEDEREYVLAPRDITALTSESAS